MSNNSYYNDAWRIINNKNQSLVSNYSMEFDNVSNVNLGNAFEGTNEGFTISFWYNTSINQTNHIISKTSNNFEIYSFADLTLYTYFGSISKNTNRIPVVLNSWQHICYVVTSTEYKGYQNGVLTVTNAFTQTPVYTNNTSDIFLSSRAGGVSSWIGKLDQTCFFDYALPATGTNSVATLYGGGTAVTNPMSLSPKPKYYAQLGDQSVDNGANYLVPNNSLQDYVFNFDETDDYIDLSVSSSSSVPSEQSSWTYSAWLYLDSTHTESFPNIFQRGQGYPGSGMLVRESGGNIQVYYGTSLAFFTVNKLLTNKWSHFALVYDISTNGLTCYINNSSQTITMVSGWSILSTTFNIGFRNNNLEYWKGEMSNVQVFNTALSATGSNSIETIYNNGSPLTSMSGFTSLQSWYKLNAQDTFDGTNWTIKDYAGSNDGTSSGMTSANLVQSNLQHTSGYSPYALDFDGINDYLDCGNVSDFNFGTGDFTVSSWINISSGNSFYRWIFGYGQTTGLEIGLNNTTNNTLRLWIAGSQLNSSESISSNTWHNLILKRESGSISAFLDNTSLTLSGSGGAGSISNNNTYIGVWGDGSKDFFQGSISNISAWNTGLTSSQISEIYNEGVPSNLHNFSGTAPVAWWQLGTNSSFNPNPMGTEGTWTCLDEIGSNNAASSNNMTNDAITDGPGYSASGLGTSSIDIIGDAPYSSANGLSENMDVLDRTTDVPS